MHNRSCFLKLSMNRLSVACRMHMQIFICMLLLYAANMPSANSFQHVSMTRCYLQHMNAVSIAQHRHVHCIASFAHESHASPCVPPKSKPSMPIQPNALQRIVSYPYYKLDQAQNFLRTELPMLQHLWPSDSMQHRLYLVMAMLFMFMGKWYNLKVPFILQHAIDAISKHGLQSNTVYQTAARAIVAYGLARAMSVICSEAKTCLFTYVSQNVLHKFARQIFQHLHALDSAFHLSTPSGVISVAYARAVRGFQTMLFQIVFAVIPTALELVMVSSILFRRFGAAFAGLTLLTFSCYLAFTVWITQWRLLLRQEIVDLDNARNGFFIDSILNHEMVKLFTNEKRELKRYDSYLRRIQQLNIDSTIAIAWLNLGQTALFGLGLTSSLLLALHKVRVGQMSVGDLVAVNAILLQLAIPFNFIGYTYQELRQSFVDMGYMRSVLSNQAPAQADSSLSFSLDLLAPRDGPSSIKFNNVCFAYHPSKDCETYSASESSMHTLRNISFAIRPGQSIALVGPSGSGKSTILKLITRMLAPINGTVLIDGVDVSQVTLESLRSRIAVVPQDTCLFDDTIEYNIKYGNENTSTQALQQAVQLSNLHSTINKLPHGLDTKVGERGARLSGGERQKVSIARAILRNPSLILCDEVTSSVDAFAEREIISALRSASAQRTTLTVAHRLSSIMHCDTILVLNMGQIVESGSHHELLAANGVYKHMWDAQNNLPLPGSGVDKSNVRHQVARRGTFDQGTS